MQTYCINRFITDAHVWLTYVVAEAKASCHSDGLVGQTEANGRKRWCVQAVTCMRRDDGLKSRFIMIIITDDVSLPENIDNNPER